MGNLKRKYRETTWVMGSVKGNDRGASGVMGSVKGNDRVATKSWVTTGMRQACDRGATRVATGVRQGCEPNYCHGVHVYC